MNNKQFVAFTKGSKLFEAWHKPSGFEFIETRDWLLFYESTLFVEKNISVSGKEIIILGLCINLCSEQSPFDALSQCLCEQDINNALYYFSGRYVIFIDGEVFLDHVGTFQVFYLQNFEVISSSLGLLSEIAGEEINLERHKELKNLGFFPGPHTIYSGINMLFSYQKLSVKGIAIREEHNCEFNCNFRDLNYFIDVTKKFIEKIGQTNSLVLPLTGGIDSRTIMAFLINTRCKFMSYTSWYKGIKWHDLVTPRILSFLFRFGHRLYFPQIGRISVLKNRIRVFRTHTGENCVDKDTFFFTYGAYPNFNTETFSTKPFVMLRGAGWAVFRGFYINDLISAQTVREKIINLTTIFPKLKECPNASESLRNWLNDEEKFKYDWRVRFYIDQRLNAWEGALQQSINLNNIDTTIVMNSQIQFDTLLFCFNSELYKFERRSNKIQKLIIKNLNEKINFIPYNFAKIKLSKRVLKIIKKY